MLTSVSLALWAHTVLVESGVSGLAGGLGSAMPVSGLSGLHKGSAGLTLRLVRWHPTFPLKERFEASPKFCTVDMHVYKSCT